MISTPSPCLPRRSTHGTLLSACLALLLCPLANARQAQFLPPPPPASPETQLPPSPEVIARITAAKTIFLSNAGGNNYFNGEIPGGPNISYSQLYASLQHWGYFQLVDSPAHADLIFQIHGTELAPNLVQASDGHHVIAQQHQPRLELSILEPSSLVPIDTITTAAGRGTDIPKGTRAFAQSIEWLTYQVSTRVSSPPLAARQFATRDNLRPPLDTLIHFTAPVPTQVLTAKNIYVVNDAHAPNSAADAYFKGFTSALAKWEHYTLSDTATTADVIFHFHDDEANGTSVTLNDPTTKAILWTITDPHHGFYHQSGSHRITALNQNLISQLKLLNHLPLTPAETSALH
jgi:hypothetical protein